jgi:hypothetical protein
VAAAVLAVRGARGIGHALFHPTCATAYATRSLSVRGVVAVVEERECGVGRVLIAELPPPLAKAVAP